MADMASCNRCGSSIEYIINCFRDCESSRQFWDRLGVWNWSHFRHSNSRVGLTSQVTGLRASLFVVALWSIWRWRNSVVLEQNPWNFYYTCRFFGLMYDEGVEFLNDDSFDMVAGLRPI